MQGDSLSDVVHLHVVLDDGDDDAEYLDRLTSLLRNDLLELDVEAVEPVTEDQVPEDAKGVAAAVGGWLAVHLGPATLKTGLRAVVNAVAAFAGRTGKTIELSIGANTLKLTGTSADVQEKVVDEFFARLASSA